MYSFDEAKDDFRRFYDQEALNLEKSKIAMRALLEAIFQEMAEVTISKVEARVKDREECIAKYGRKYRQDAEANGEPYNIARRITDLVGLRIVCLYETEVELIKERLDEEFQIIGVTDKISELETTEGSFGYKGLHVDLGLKGERRTQPEYKRFSDFQFEVQIRTIVQDAWSEIDHKIKYKKSIPTPLKRRVNLLAALFELADREFRAIRDDTLSATSSDENSIERIEEETKGQEALEKGQGTKKTNSPETNTAINRFYNPLDAFSFLRIANHFFPDFEFEDEKVDGFVAEIQSLSPGISRGKFNFYMKTTIAKVKDYSKYMSENHQIEMNPYTVMRHCLSHADKKLFGQMLSPSIAVRFEVWLKDGKVLLA